MDYTVTLSTLLSLDTNTKQRITEVKAELYTMRHAAERGCSLEELTFQEKPKQELYKITSYAEFIIFSIYKQIDR